MILKRLVRNKQKSSILNVIVGGSASIKVQLMYYLTLYMP